VCGVCVCVWCVCVGVCVCVFVALVIQHAKRMRHLVKCVLPRSTRCFDIDDTIFEQKTIEQKCTFCFSLQILSQNFLILKRIERDIFKNVYRSSSK